MNKNLSDTNKLAYITIILLILEIITVTAPVVILRSTFDFPDILRKPAKDAFELFKQNESYIILGYYIFVISSLLFIPMSYFLKQVYSLSTNKIALEFLAGLGIATTIFQTLGFIRWIFVMPFLTENYFNNPENEKPIALIYETLNRFAGMSVGEHLGFIAMGSWVICLGIIILNHPNCSKWLGFTGILIGFLLIISVLEHFGGKLASIWGQVNFLSNTVFTFWLLWLSLSIWKLNKNQSLT